MTKTRSLHHVRLGEAEGKGSELNMSLDVSYRGGGARGDVVKWDNVAKGAGFSRR
jgi:hypothetical protein